MKGVYKTTFAAFEAVIGRRALWRLARAAYYHSRRDFENTIASNGERMLQQNVARFRTGAIIFDVGANVGDWSKSYLAIDPTAQITAFEPDPTAREQLSRLPITIVASAVSDHEGEVGFLSDGQAGGTNSIASEGTDASISVPVTTVDAFCTERGIEHIDLLKIDVEGFDSLVLKGARRMFERSAICVAQFEYNWRWISTKSNLRDIFTFVGKLPYRVGKVVPHGIELYDEWHPELERYIEGNYALVRSDMLRTMGARSGSFDRSNTYAC